MIREMWIALVRWRARRIMPAQRAKNCHREQEFASVNRDAQREVGDQAVIGLIATGKVSRIHLPAHGSQHWPLDKYSRLVRAPDLQLTNK